MPLPGMPKMPSMPWDAPSPSPTPPKKEPIYFESPKMPSLEPEPYVKAEPAPAPADPAPAEAQPPIMKAEDKVQADDEAAVAAKAALLRAEKLAKLEAEIRALELAK